MADMNEDREFLENERDVPVEILPSGEVVPSNGNKPVKPTTLGKDRKGEY